MDRAERDALVSALDRLPPEQRDVLRLRFVDGRDVADTARAMGRAEAEIVQLQARALRALRRVLEPGARPV